VSFDSVLFVFRCFNAKISLHISFLFLALLVFVLLVEGKEPRISDSDFDSCAIHALVSLLRDGVCTSSISADRMTG
jgi:hypothetical protein